jgi:RHS repeat-associated protein
VVANAASIDSIFFGDDTAKNTISVRAGIRFELSQRAYHTSREIVKSFGRRSGTNWTRSVTLGLDSSMRIGTITPSGAASTRIRHGGQSTVDTILLSEGLADQSLRHRRPTGEISLIEYVNAGALSRTIGYDTLGRIISEQHPGGSDARSYGYDVRNQLTSWITGGTGAPCTISASAPDNTSCAVTPGTAFSSGYDGVHNPSGPTIQTGNRMVAQGSTSAQYDADGNMTQRVRGSDTLTLWWNSVSQLDSAHSTLRGTVRYAYDGLGRRIRRSTAAADRWYLYDEHQIIADLDANGDVVTSYSYFPGIDRPHSLQTAGGTTYWFLDDGRGNVAGLVNASGALKARYTYNPFGVGSLDPGAAQAGMSGQPGFDSLGNRMRFASREYDVTLDMYDMRRRFYDPQLQRFISEDPSGIGAGINLYAYVTNNPITLRDPFGADGCDAQHIDDGWVTVPVEGVRGGALCYKPYVLPTVTVTARDFGFPELNFDGLDDLPESFSDYLTNRIADQAGFTGGGGGFGGFGGSGGSGGGGGSPGFPRPGPLHLWVLSGTIDELIGCRPGWQDWGPIKGAFAGESVSVQGDAKKIGHFDPLPGILEETGIYGMRLVASSPTQSTGKIVGVAQVDCETGKMLFGGRSARF